MVTELFAPSVGGQQVRFEALARSLAKLGDDVTVLTTRNDRKAPAEEIIDGVRIVRAPLVPRYERPLLKPLQRSLPSVVRFALRSRRELVDGDYDAVYFNQWPYLHVAITPRDLRRRAGIDWCEYRSGLVHRAFAKLLARAVGFNASVNDWTGQQLGSATGVPIHYLPTGVDCSRFRSAPPAERRGLLFVGRLVPNKNLPLLLDGYAALAGMGFAEELRIAGDGPERHALETHLHRLPQQIQGRIHLEGNVSDERKVVLLSSSQALLLPSRREGFPNVVAEAMASGLPVATVASPLNGAARAVERYGAGVVGAPTPEGFAKAILQVVSAGSEMSERCLAAAAEIDWTNLATQLHELLVGVSENAAPEHAAS